MSDLAFDRMIDITADLCPMTFVRTRLALDRMTTGEVLLVRLKGTEPLENVPRMAEAQGHAVLHREIGTDGVTSLWLRHG
jgi:tRNA 2-thiouridine synthesizing protein A